MSEIIPYSSFNTDSLTADFPGLKILGHADDYTAGALTWATRAGSLVLTLAAAATKDANGVYTTVTNSVASVAGTMPTLSKYAVALCIGNLQTSSASAGVAATFGSLSTGPYVINTGTFTDNTALALMTAVALTGSITAGSKACQAAYWDCVDTTTPDAFRVMASGLVTDQAIPNSTSTENTGQFILGAVLASAMSLTGLGGLNDGRRIKLFALFDFGVPLSMIDLKIACTEMARTQELFAGWRHRATA